MIEIVSVLEEITILVITTIDGSSHKNNANLIINLDTPKEVIWFKTSQAPKLRGHTMDNLSLRLIQQENYRFEIQFNDEIPPITGDEPPPLDKSEGISPIQLLAAAVANCLSDSLLFSLRKLKQSADPI